MKPCEFSETQFAFCFTFELISLFYPRVLPFFPNTVAEGKPGGGYDVKIGGNIFFQFKIPRYYDKYKRYWNVFKSPCLKIETYVDSKQFFLLTQLCSADSTNQVYYVAPEFYRQICLNNYYNANEIVKNSAFFGIRDFPRHGTGKHALIYDQPHEWGVIFSQPLRINKQNKQNIIGLHNNTDKNYRTLSEYASHLRNLLIEIAPDTSEFLSGINDHATLIKHIRGILLTNFNIHWYPIIIPGEITI
jgi:hypothetical protein